ncbi:MAG: hypothetical protein JJ979_07265 [Roseibium sp.]|nr:hypothetical protein [Roseibium sp.]
MEKDGSSGLETGAVSGPTDHELLEQIHRELARLDLPCACKEELDRTIVAIEMWHALKTRRELVRSIKSDYEQLVSGISFLTDLGEIDQIDLTQQDLRDHSESLKFLADMADRCARSLTRLSSEKFPGNA